MELYTIGFTRKSAAQFFGLLRESGAKRVVDIRRRNTSGLAGWAKKDDLGWLLRELCGMDYIHLPKLAPSDELLDAYRKKQISWDQYVPVFTRQIERRLIHALHPPRYNRRQLPAVQRTHRRPMPSSPGSRAPAKALGAT